MERRPGIGRWIALALAFQAVLAALDIATGHRLIFTATYVLAPFALAVAGHARATAALAVTALGLAIVSGFWNHYVGSADHLIRISIVAAGGALATLAAQAIETGAAQRRQMAILAAVGRLSGADTLERAISGLADALVPAAGDGCWVDLTEGDGTPRRLFEHGAESPGPTTDGTPRLLDDGHRALVPLFAGETTIGHLGVTATRTRYDEDDLEFLTLVAGRVALVLANARLVSDLRSTRSRLDGILNNLAEAVTVNDEQGRTVYANPAAARLLGKPSQEEVTAARPGELAARFTITDEHGNPVQIGDFPGRKLVQNQPGPELLTRSIDRVTGRAYWLLTKASLFTDQGRRYAVNIIEDVTEAKEAEQRQRFLARAGQLLASSLDYEQTLKRVAALAVPWLADWCAVELPAENGSIELVALVHVDPDKVALAQELRRRFPPDPAADTGVPGVLKGGPPELITDISDELLREAVDDPEQLEALRDLGMRSLMIVPMRSGDATLGTITFVTADSGRRFSEDDFAFAQDLALRAGTALQNARLYAHQQHVAHTLQASLLPDALPRIPGFSLAAGYQAGAAEAEVGGDFYDVVKTPRGHLVFLGDVTGKGIEAAARTALARHSIRTAARFDPSPGAILRLLNEILVEQPRLAPVTVTTLLIADGTVTLAAAGHPPPLLRRGPIVTPIGPGGMLLGVAGGQHYEETTHALEPGDTILLYTDGATDTPGATDRFGTERLAVAFAQAPADAAGVLAAIEEALERFQVGSAIDDRALLVLRHR